MASNTLSEVATPAPAALKDILQPLDNILREVLSLSPAMLLVLSLIILGRALKEFPPIPNRWIPAILFPAGAVGWCLMTAWSIVHFLQGQLFGAAAVGLNQLWKLSFAQTLSLIFGKTGSWLSSVSKRARKVQPPQP